jgi:hypothetical protein
VPSAVDRPARDWVRSLRIVAAVAVLATALPIAGCEHAALYVSWAAPPRLTDCDLRPFSEPTLHGQLVHYWSLIGRWGIVWLSGFLLVGRWSDRLRRPLRLAIIATPLVLGLGVLIWPATGARPLNPTPVASAEGLGCLVGMRFPAGTKVIEAKASHALDWTVAAKLTMPTDAVEPFIHGPFVTRFADRRQYPEPRLTVSHTDLPEFAFADQPQLSDWHPERLARFVSADISGVGQYVCSLAADLSDPHTSTVYFEFAVF